MQDPREAFAEGHSSLSHKTQKLTDQAADDLRYFAKLAEQGKPVTFAGLQEWMRDKHGIQAGRTRLKSLIRTAGGEPWFSH